jgi:hypothetical protein
MRTLKLSLLLLTCLGIVSCAAFRNGSPPTKAEQALFSVQTNYVPTIVTVTNPPTVTGQPPVVTTQTNLQPTYTYSPGPTITSAEGVASLIPGYGGIAGTAIGALAALWAWLRSSKNGATAATLAQEIEAIRGVIKALPNGSTLDTALTNWLTQHQAETGTIQSVLTILENDVSNPNATVAAQQIIAAINALNPTALPPGTAVKV